MKTMRDMYAKRRIRPISVKKSQQDREYRNLRKEFFADPTNQVCQARLHGCLYAATDIHHKRGRGIYYLMVSTWLAVCRRCHTWITENSRLAISMGLSESRLNNNRYEESTFKDGPVRRGIPVDFDTSP